MFWATFILIGGINMNSSFFKPFLIYFLIIFFICVFFIPVYSAYPEYFTNTTEFTSFDLSQEYIWPIPGYTKLTSYFGKRKSPTAGASSFHKGIDIGAPEGTKLYAICDGEITFADFLGGGGYTITLSANDNIKITYCHVSPNFLVSVRRYGK
jgi:murein DD-endopeptidase MepM/ murein hydrolase activator NlpD